MTATENVERPQFAVHLDACPRQPNGIDAIQLLNILLTLDFRLKTRRR